MTDVEKYEILHIWHVCDVENVAIYANLATIYALSCGEKLSPKVHLWRKMTNMRSDLAMAYTLPPPGLSIWHDG